MLIPIIIKSGGGKYKQKKGSPIRRAFFCSVILTDIIFYSISYVRNLLYVQNYFLYNTLMLQASLSV